jgi:hypothetical protein
MFLIRLIFSLDLKIPFIQNFPKKNVANRPVVLVDLPHQKKKYRRDGSETWARNAHHLK